MGTRETPAVTPDLVRQLAFGFAPPIMIDTAVRLGLFDELAKAGKNVPELSHSLGASERGLRAVMNALVGIQLLAKNGEGTYSLTPASSAFLVRGKPGYMGGWFRRITTQSIHSWLKLHDVVVSGEPAVEANQEESGTAFFQNLVEDLFPMNYVAAQALGDALGIAGAANAVRVLDLAAGSGVWGIALAHMSEKVTVTAVDWPGVLEVTRKMAGRHGVADRFSYSAGDLLEADFGTGHNLATLGHIVHSMGERDSRELIGKVYQALAPGGTIAIAEFLVNDDRTGPAASLIFAVNMLVHTEEGDTFSFNEIAGWLQEAGFRDIRAAEVPGPSPVIVANRP